MSFVLAPHETPGAGLTRVITEQAAKLAVECVEAGQDPSAFAHKARVRCKRVRAALRLAKPLVGDKVYGRENRWWRDQARKLSELRDAGARLEALDTLRPFLATRIGSAMTRKLGERFETNRTQVDAAAAIAEFVNAMDKRADDLIPQIADGGREEMARALGDTYKLARSAMKHALEDEEPELLHEWRKQAKYHALQARLLRLTFPDALEKRVAAVRDLAGLLGEAQDIEVVKAGSKGWREAPRGFRDVLEVRRKALVTGARATGAALFAGKPRAWMKELSPPVMADE
ncbi:MAG: CHAD domain-containing protein [Hyphomonadaceae bacterium]